MQSSQPWPKIGIPDLDQNFCSVEFKLLINSFNPERRQAMRDVTKSGQQVCVDFGDLLRDLHRSISLGKTTLRIARRIRDISFLPRSCWSFDPRRRRSRPEPTAQILVRETPSTGPVRAVSRVRLLQHNLGKRIPATSQHPFGCRYPNSLFGPRSKYGF